MPRLRGEPELHGVLRAIQEFRMTRECRADELNKGRGNWAAEIECD